MSEEQYSEQSYKSALRAWWLDIITLSKDYWQNTITDNPDPDTTSKFISNLTRFWLELRPYISAQNKDVSADFKKSYEGFEKFYHSPSLLYKTSADDIPKLEAILREAVFKLGISEV